MRTVISCSAGKRPANAANNDAPHPLAYYASAAMIALSGTPGVVVCTTVLWLAPQSMSSGRRYDREIKLLDEDSALRIDLTTSQTPVI